MTSAVLMDTALQARRRFISAASSAVGVANVRLLWTPAPTEGLTQLDGGPVARTWTHATSPNPRLSRLGQGMALAFNGTSDFLSTPDAADLSFLTGGMSIFAVANVTDTAGARDIISKEDFGGVQEEYVFAVNATDQLSTTLIDQSATARPRRDTDAAITQGAWVTLSTSCVDVAQAATVAAGITVYQNGAVRASTATENAAYVAMENLTARVEIGSQNVGTASFFAGSLALVMLIAANLTAAQHMAMTQLARSYFGVPL